MIIYLKNKHQLGIRNMVKQVLDQEGIPDYIEIDQHEAWGLMKEMQEMRGEATYKKKFIIEQEDGGHSYQFKLWGGNEITEAIAKEIIEGWLKNEFILVYVHKERDPKNSTPTNTVYIEADVEIHVKLRTPQLQQHPNNQ